MALNEMYRILRKGGSFICSFPMDPNVELLEEDAVHSGMHVQFKSERSCSLTGICIDDGLLPTLI